MPPFPCFIPATTSDIPALQTLASQVWHDHYPGIITLEQIEYMLQMGYSTETITTEITQEAITWLKIIVDTDMVGFAAFGAYGKSGKQVKLHKLYLSVTYHGQGIGTAALTEVERQATAKGATSIILNVNKNNSKAIASYQRNGYRIIESVVNDIGNGFVMDDYVMQKQLGKAV